MKVEELITYTHQKDVLRNWMDQNLPPDKTRRGWICPFCGNGEGKGAGDGLVIFRGDSGDYLIHCFSGCDKTWDLIKFVREWKNLEFIEACKRIANDLGIYLELNNAPKTSYDNTNSYNSNNNYNNNKKFNVDQNKNNNKSVLNLSENTNNFLDEHTKQERIEQIKNAQQNINNPILAEYNKERGISEDTARKLGLGFVKNQKFKNKGGEYIYLPGVLYPKGNFKGAPSYAVRSIEGKYHTKSYKNGGLPFNWVAYANKDFDRSEPIFIVEGLYDLASVIELGYNCIALDGKEISFLDDILRKHNITNPLILMLDNDKAGFEATYGDKEKNKVGLYQELKNKGFEVYVTEILKRAEYKDPNDYLRADRDGFKRDLENTKNHYKELDPEFKSRKQAVTESFAVNKLDKFLNGIRDSIECKPIETGFTDLDGYLDGGFYEGLYTIGAISSLGKTTFSLQVADQVAENGNDVIFFSLEMSENELMAKSISRQSAILAGWDEENNLENLADLNEIEITPLTIRDILNGDRWRLWEKLKDIEKQKLLEDSVNDYFYRAGKHIRIIEAQGDMTVGKIREIVKEHIEVTGNKPLVLIDYLQLLAPPEENSRLNEKQIVDKNVFMLKQITRDFKIPILAISSLNRGSYTKSVGMEAFKESGAIEYSSDVLFGLERQIMTDEGIEKTKADEAKKKIKIRKAEKKESNKGIKHITLKILKNRNGRAFVDIYFDFDARFNYFKLTEDKYNPDSDGSESFEGEFNGSKR